MKAILNDPIIGSFTVRHVLICQCLIAIVAVCLDNPDKALNLGVTFVVCAVFGYLAGKLEK